MLCPPLVQLLTATVKIFLKQPARTQEMVQRVLNMATEGTDNPDLRDRGFVYWRLLSHSPQVIVAAFRGLGFGSRQRCILRRITVQVGFSRLIKIVHTQALKKSQALYRPKSSNWGLFAGVQG